MPDVYLVVAGDLSSDKNPGLMPEGWKRAFDLRKLLPERPPHVVCGTGKRHVQLARALNLVPTRWTPIVGGPERTLHAENGGTVRLADGTRVSAEHFTGTHDRAELAKMIITHLQNNSVVITCGETARDVLRLADLPDAVTLIQVLTQFQQLADYEFIVPQRASES